MGLKWVSSKLTCETESSTNSVQSDVWSRYDPQIVFSSLKSLHMLFPHVHDNFKVHQSKKKIPNQNPILSQKNPRLLEKTARWGWFSNVALGGIIIQVWLVEAWFLGAAYCWLVLNGNALKLEEMVLRQPGKWSKIILVQKYSASKILFVFVWFGGWTWWDFMISFQTFGNS